MITRIKIYSNGTVVFYDENFNILKRVDALKMAVDEAKKEHQISPEASIETAFVELKYQSWYGQDVEIGKIVGIDE